MHRNQKNETTPKENNKAPNNRERVRSHEAGVVGWGETSLPWDSTVTSRRALG